MAATEVNLSVFKHAHYGAKIFQGIFQAPDFMKAKISHKGDARKRIYALSYECAADNVVYDSDSLEDMSFLCSHVHLQGQTLYTRHYWDHTYTKQITYDDFPHWFCRENNEPTLTHPNQLIDEGRYYAPAPETKQEFYERMMPFLHEIAWAGIDQDMPHIPHWTGNSRNVKNAIRDTASKKRYQSTVDRFRVPIGYAVHQLEAHLSGTPILTRGNLEALIRELHEVLIKEDSWLKHHKDHDYAYWNKHLDACRVLYETRDGDVELLVDLAATTKKNMPPETEDAAIKVATEKWFHEIATTHFTTALYTPHREYVKKRKLTFQQYGV